MCVVVFVFNTQHKNRKRRIKRDREREGEMRAKLNTALGYPKIIYIHIVENIKAYNANNNNSNNGSDSEYRTTSYICFLFVYL